TFVQWCRDRGVTVVAALPPFMAFPEYQTNGFFEFARAIGGLFESLGVEMLGSSESSLFKRGQFFDTWYHLNSEAAGGYSEWVARALGKTPRYEGSVQGGIDLSRARRPHFGQAGQSVSIRW